MENTRPQLRYPVIYDGDGVRPSGEPFGEECRGHWVMTASSKLKPQVVHTSNIRAELSPSDIYSGMYARVTVRMYPYANNGNRGVGCGLGNVLKTRDGEALSGHASAESDFAGIAAEYQQSVPAQQPPYPAPQAGYPQPYVDPITGQMVTPPRGA